MLNQSQVAMVLSILSKNPRVTNHYAGDGQTGQVGEVYFVTDEDPDNQDNDLGLQIATLLGLECMTNDCEGCFNEYMVY
jgi:hypothetical protein